MILGLISFMLFIFEVFGLLNKISELDQIGLEADSNMVSLLHVVHICLFLVMVIYILLVLFLYALTKWNRRYWAQTEQNSNIGSHKLPNKIFR